MKLNKSTLVKHLFPLILSISIGATVAYFSGQDHNWDLLNYHFYDPYAFLNHREYTDFAPAGLQTFLNPALDILSFLLISHLSSICAAMIIGAIQGLLIWLVYEISLIILGSYLKDYCLLALAFFIGLASFFGAGNLSEVGGTMGDNTSAIFVLLGLMLFLVSRNKNNKLIGCIGFLSIGVAVGLKLTNLPYALALVILELITIDKFRIYLKGLMLDGSSLILGFLSSYGFWGIYLERRFGNPLFPYYNNFFQSKYYANTNFTDSRFFPRGFLQTVFYPFYFDIKQHLVAEVLFRDIRLSVLYVAIIVLVVAFFGYMFIFKRPLEIPKNTVYLLVFVVISYVLWEYKFSIYRYLIPVELLSLIAIASVIFILVKRNLISSILTVVLICIITAFTVPMNWGRVKWENRFFYVKFPYEVSSRSLVVMAGSQPEGYIVPFLPHSVPVIRVVSSLDKGKNAAVNNLLKSEIDKYRRNGLPLYGVSYSSELSDYRLFGFKTYDCKNIKTNGLSNESILLCRLTML